MPRSSIYGWILKAKKTPEISASTRASRSQSYWSRCIIIIVCRSNTFHSCGSSTRKKNCSRFAAPSVTDDIPTRDERQFELKPVSATDVERMITATLPNITCILHLPFLTHSHQFIQVRLVTFATTTDAASCGLFHFKALVSSIWQWPTTTKAKV